MIECRIVDVIPEAQHGGTVYTQTVVCELPDGRRLLVFDSTPTILSETLVDEDVTVDVLGRPSEAQVVPTTDERIEITENEHIYTGRISEVEAVGRAEIEAIEIDVGVGTIHVESNDQLLESIEESELVPGTYISCTCFRTDVVGYEPI